ncbi:putative odorant receptor 85d isoform X2 [Linepithema humile]|uniref:putative odorant receptor 85d isoform X2 n=1 Tax=Linepithema humile TaxID=83485 RepID=UPI00351ECD6F
MYIQQFYNEGFSVDNLFSFLMLESKPAGIYKILKVVFQCRSVSLKTMEVTWNHYYDIVCKITSLTGMWPYMKPKLKRFTIILLVISMMTVIIPQINYQLTCEGDLQCIIRAVTSYVMSAICVVKVCTFQLNTRAIKNLTHHLFEDWKQLKTAEEYEIMKSYAKTGRQYCLIYFVYSCLAVFAFLSMTLIPYSLDIFLPLNESRPVLMPFFANWFVDFREYFFPIYVHSVVAWELIMSGLVAHDCLIMTFIEHICSIFSVVGSVNVVQIFIDFASNIYFTTVMQKWKWLAQLLEKLCTVSFFIQMFIVVVALSTTMTEVIRMETDGILESTRYALYSIGQLLHLFFLSFEGQKLIDHSLQIREKIYSSLWYNASTKSKKLLVLLMMKGLQPSFISAGKIYIFSLESFAMVLQTSMSYCTILASA